MLGVVSAAPSVVGNSADLGWSGRKLRDEWGALVYQDGAPLQNPAYDPAQPYTSRRHRPESWSCVALLGQVRVRIGHQVEEGDYLMPGADGCALGTLARPDGRPVEVMEITSPYEKARGYGVALCLVG